MLRKSFKTQFGKLVSSFLFLAIFVGCAGVVNNRGNTPDPELLANLKEGVTTKSQIVELLGSPSSFGAFDANSWFYINEKSERVAWFDSKIIKRQILVLRFDQNDVLSEKKELSLSDSKAVAPVSRKTPTHGRKLGFLEQLVGNFRRFTNK